MKAAKPRKRYLAAFVCILGLALMGAFHRQFLPLMLEWLDVGEEPVVTRAVFVLFGDADTRPYVAAALVNSGYAQEILMGEHRVLALSPQNPPGHVVYKHVMLHRGVPEDRIHIVPASVSNTMNESGVLGEYLAAHPNELVTVVTSLYHTRRTRWSLRHKLGDQAERLRFVSAPHDDFDASNWWQYPTGFELILMEYIKLTAYVLVYGHAVWYCLAIGVICVLWYSFRRQTPVSVSSAN